jgi:hypothetical protein
MRQLLSGVKRPLGGFGADGLKLQSSWTRSALLALDLFGGTTTSVADGSGAMVCLPLLPSITRLVGSIVQAPHYTNVLNRLPFVCCGTQRRPTSQTNGAYIAAPSI